MMSTRHTYSPMDQTQFRQVLGTFVSGVTVVLTEVDGEIHGLTVNSFSSLSLDPPLILVCIAKLANTHPKLVVSQQFSVCILADDQREISSLFSKPQNDISGILLTRTPQSSVPSIEGSLAALWCEKTMQYDGGDHTVFIGRVVDMVVNHAKKPLVFYRGQYGHFHERAPIQ